VVQNLKKIGSDNVNRIGLTEIRCNDYENYVVLFDIKVLLNTHLRELGASYRAVTSDT
jgi:hypothetical protein